MSFEITALHHVNVTVPQALEAATKHFYGVILGFEQLQKPVSSRVDVGAWYQLGALQLHLSIEDEIDNWASDRHVCYVVRDVAAADSYLREQGVVVIPDPRPIPGRPRIYVRDPGGNLIEIAQLVSDGSMTDNGI
jgi:catechol 2,3-dioxygenase-like lactoylglutathione lyase family enzyme